MTTALRTRAVRLLLPAALVAAGLAALIPTVSAQAADVEVWKDPNCGCCSDWIKHMESNGFTVTVHQTGNREARSRLGMPDRHASCHTAKIGRYVIEGHVPAADIRRLLQQQPDAVGLAVPGMPLGSPGMDGPAYGNRRMAYQVLLVQANGGDQVFQSYPAQP